MLSLTSRSCCNVVGAIANCIHFFGVEMKPSITMILSLLSIEMLCGGEEGSGDQQMTTVVFFIIVFCTTKTLKTVYSTLSYY